MGLDKKPKKRFHEIASSENDGDIKPKDDDDNISNPWTHIPFSSHYFELKKIREALPIHQAKDKLLRLVDENQFVVLVGETGSGKTTQVPAFLAKHLLLTKTEGDKKLAIACTQPRRVAAMSVARRVAAELDVPLGQGVGYSIRFEDCSTPDVTFCKYLTDGMLLREALTDKLLSRYAAIVLDEAHERTIATDLLMGLLKQHIVPKRPDLKVVVMSATLESQKFQNYFDNCPVLQVSGRTFPVDIFYSKQPESDYFEAVIRTVLHLHTTQPLPGDILVFLTGEEEIEDACRRVHFLPNCKNLIALPLYSSLPNKAQERIFDPAPTGKRKVIFSTNIAETSLTIDGIVYVVDPGFCKQKIYHPQQRLESLLVSPISQASARQRAGRAGRTQPGKCYRLYTEQSFLKDLRPESYPEVLRCNLANVILQLKALGVDDLVHFDFVDPPAPESLMRALETLMYLGGLNDEDGSMTKLGWQLSELPLDPCLGKTLITGCQLGVPSSTLALASCLSVPPIFMRPNDDKLAADTCKAALSHPEGDHLTMLSLFIQYVDKFDTEGDEAAKDWCWENYLSHHSLSQAHNIYQQLIGMMKKQNFKNLNDDSKLAKADRDALMKEAIVAGFFMQAAARLKGKSNAFQCIGPAATVVKVHPGTCLLPGNGDWIVYHEMVMTSQQYLRTVCAIRPELLLKYGTKFFLESSTWPRNEAHRQLEILQISLTNRK